MAFERIRPAGAADGVSRGDRVVMESKDVLSSISEAMSMCGPGEIVRVGRITDQASGIDDVFVASKGPIRSDDAPPLSNGRANER
jgi:hypothetical protein